MPRKNKNKKLSLEERIEKRFKRHIGVLVEHFENQVELIGEQYTGVIKRLEKNEKAIQKF